MHFKENIGLDTIKTALFVGALLFVILFLNSILPQKTPFSQNLFSDKYSSTMSGSGFDPVSTSASPIDSEHNLQSQLHALNSSNITGNHLTNGNTHFILSDTHIPLTSVHQIDTGEVRLGEIGNHRSDSLATSTRTVHYAETNNATYTISSTE